MIGIISRIECLSLEIDNLFPSSKLTIFLYRGYRKIRIIVKKKKKTYCYWFLNEEPTNVLSMACEKRKKEERTIRFTKFVKSV